MIEFGTHWLYNRSGGLIRRPAEGAVTQEKHRHTFISYSRVNKEFAVKLARELKAAGFPIWLDLLDIPAGARWDDEIEKALRECGIFMTILTPAAIASENAKDEIGYAIDHGKRIIPVLLEDCEVPLRLRRFQYVDFTSMNYDQGVNAAKELLDRLMKEKWEPRSGKALKPKEPPTQPAIQVHSEHRAKSEPSETAESPAQSSGARPIALYAGVAIVVVLVLGATFWLLRGGLFSAQPTPTSVLTPDTQNIEPVSIVSPTVIPETTAPELQDTYVEEFDGTLDAWTFVTKAGKDEEFHYAPQNGALAVQINPKQDQPWAHLIHGAFKYKDVQLEAVVTNNGINGNGVSLICRYSDQGWIEFTVSNNQNYSIFVYGPDGETLLGGPAGSNKIRAGKVQNNYTATCKGDEVSLAVNGELVRTLTISEELPEGNIGMGFSAPLGIPIDVAVESLKVSEP
jgi:hypothetical protein